VSAGAGPSEVAIVAEQRELPLSFPDLSSEIPFIPVRMVNE